MIALSASVADAQVCFRRRFGPCCCPRSVLNFQHVSTHTAPRMARSNSTSLSSALHFYQNKQLEIYAGRETKRLTLRQLIFYGRSMSEQRLIMAANYVRTELPVRIAHRLRDIQALPFIVVTQEEVARVYELYWSAFDKFRAFPPIKTMADNLKFCKLVRTLLDEHASIIPSLILGLSLSSHHLEPERLDVFITRMLVSRISRRVLAEHHIALTEDFLRNSNKGSHQTGRSVHVGIINTELSPRRSIEKCSELLRTSPRNVVFADPDRAADIGLECPRVVIDGHIDTKFAYIRDQFEYIVFELLKNAMYATSLQHPTSTSLPNIRATIATGQDEIQVRISDQGGGLVQPEVSSPAGLLSFSHARNRARLDTTRITALKSVSSRPQGMRATVDEQLEAWKEDNNLNTPERKAGVGIHTRLGIGLPMSNIFATYFGGSLELVSLDGWATDVYLRLPRLGTKLEGI